MTERKFGFYEFFAGGGLARLGLGAKWSCLMANDICHKKAMAYLDNFRHGTDFRIVDVASLSPRDVPGHADVAWASFPCQDLSLAGNREGLKANRSGTFWPFWGLMRDLRADGRDVPVIVLENVLGAITSHAGRDFAAIVEAMAQEDYRVGGLTIDAAHFVPQSRPRLFFIAVKGDLPAPEHLLRDDPLPWCHATSLVQACAGLPAHLRRSWIWWNLPAPPAWRVSLRDLIENNPAGVRWHTQAETDRLLSQMSPRNLEKVRTAQRLGRSVVGTVYKRTRRDAQGRKVQRAEVRFDDISGCLRTPAGGSSRQTVLVVNGDNIQSRLLSAREAARLMGVPDSYKLPANYNDAYHLMGDGLVVPVVSWLEAHIVRTLARANRRFAEAA